MSSRKIAWYIGLRSKLPPSSKTCSFSSSLIIFNPFFTQTSDSLLEKNKPAKTNALALENK